MNSKTMFKLFMSILIFLSIYSLELFGQSSEMDSIILGKDLAVMEGKIPTYYSSQCEKRAKESQLFLQKMTETYSVEGNNDFNLKLAVLHSSQWNGFSIPYGLFFIYNGWIVIPGDADFQKFSHIWSYYPFIDVMKNNLRKVCENPEEEFVEVLYGFNIAHELGHYYVKNVLKAFSPDKLTDELIASYFALDYLYKTDKNTLKIINSFASTYMDNFEPEYRTVDDFNTKYIGVGVQNYAWYHCVFLLMIEDILSNGNSNFMNLYAQAFHDKDESKNMSKEKILKTLDDISKGKSSEWLKKMEGI